QIAGRDVVLATPDLLVRFADEVLRLACGHLLTGARGAGRRAGGVEDGLDRAERLLAMDVRLAGDELGDARRSVAVVTEGERCDGRVVAALRDRLELPLGLRELPRRHRLELAVGRRGERALRDELLAASKRLGGRREVDAGAARDVRLALLLIRRERAVCRLSRREDREEEAEDEQEPVGHDGTSLAAPVPSPFVERSAGSAPSMTRTRRLRDERDTVTDGNLAVKPSLCGSQRGAFRRSRGAATP